MSKKETYIAFLLDLIEDLGINETSRISSSFCEKYKVSTRTFDKYWKQAKERHLEILQAIQLKKIEQKTALELEASKERVLDRIEAEEILTRIARGVETDIADIPLEITPHERIKAISDLSKMKGWNEPKKTEHTLDDTIKSVIGMVIK